MAQPALYRSVNKRLGLNQSCLKSWEYQTPMQWLKEWVLFASRQDAADHFDFGSLVDCLLFTPLLLDGQFVITDIKFPPEAVKKIMDFVYDAHTQMNSALLSAGIAVKTPSLSDYEDIMYQKSQEKVWVTEKGEKKQKNLYGGDSYSRERVVKEIVAKGEEYFNKRCEVGGRTIVTLEDNVKALELIDVLRTNPVTRPYFIEQEGETLLFQHEIFAPFTDLSHSPFFAENGIEESMIYLKGALDIVRINHIGKWIKVPDFKTTFDAYKHNFFRQIKKYKYGTQASFYDNLIRIWRDENYPDYEIHAPSNITIDPNMKVPQIYEYDKADLKILKEGGFTKSGYHIKGWEESLSEILWHIENNVWDNSRDMIENGKIMVKLFD